jgi:hypothetical protein
VEQAISCKKPTPAYRCPCCGEEYAAIPLCFGGGGPDFLYSIPSDEYQARVRLETSLCVIDNEHFFHRGRITIPILGHPEDLVFNVWTTIKAENFQLRIDNWRNPERAATGPYFGWLQTLVPSYGDTLNIKAMAFENGLDEIPRIEVFEENHPLTLDQKQGITFQKALSIINEIMRKEHQSRNP